MRGVIAAGDPATAAAGAKMLSHGGNAADAAVAAAFASFIAEVGLVHLGGSGLAQVFRPGKERGQEQRVIYDFFSSMPGLGAARRPEELDFERVTVDFGPATQDFFLGRGSVAVPGNIAGLCRLAAEHGTMPLSTLLAPAIRLAREGVALAPFQAETCELLSPLYGHTAGMREIFMPQGRPIRAHEWLTIPHLAETLEALASEGAAYARTGRLARAIVQDQEQHGGLLTMMDLADYEVRRLEPIQLTYRDYEVLLPPPSSSGGVLTAFALKLLGHFPVRALGHGSSGHLRLLYEVMAATTRARPLWERASSEMPAESAVATFLADENVAPHVEAVRRALAHGQRSPVLREQVNHPDTSHISVVDGQGMAVSLTTTAGESAGYVVPNTGYIPNNILGEEDLHPGGFHNLPPGKRISTMMTPTVVLLDGRVRLVVGSGGSIRIRSAILQVLSNLLDFGLSLDEAVNHPRVHLEGGVLQAELGVNARALSELSSMGYPVNRWDKRSIYFGGAHSVSCTLDGQLAAAGDSRRGGAVAEVF
jgi:gamma-glutamyltranspeptidase / glutathione hydrolase